MHRPSWPAWCALLALSTLAACANKPPPTLPPVVTVTIPTAAPTPLPADAPVVAPRPPDSVAELEASLADLLSDSGVRLEKPADGVLLLRAAGDAAFAPSSANLTPRFAAFVQQLSARLVSFPAFAVKVTGHTDATGGDKRNDKLSAARATAALRALVQHGVSSHRVTAEGKGKREPIAGNDTAQGRAANRRVDILISEPSR